MQRIELKISPQTRQQPIVLLICNVEPLECLILVSPQFEESIIIREEEEECMYQT
jgi:hypothetical protein